MIKINIQRIYENVPGMLKIHLTNSYLILKRFIMTKNDENCVDNYLGISICHPQNVVFCKGNTIGLQKNFNGKKVAVGDFLTYGIFKFRVEEASHEMVIIGKKTRIEILGPFISCNEMN